MGDEIPFQIIDSYSFQCMGTTPLKNGQEERSVTAIVTISNTGYNVVSCIRLHEDDTGKMCSEEINGGCSGSLKCPYNREPK